MSPSNIASAASKVIAGELNVETSPWYCLKVTRQIVEHAYGWTPGEFYQHYWREKVEENTTDEPWARDLERSLRNMGYAVPTLEPGYLIFDYTKAKPWGHVAVMLTSELLLENTPAPRGFRGRGALRVTHIREWGEPTTIIRLPEK